MAGFSTQNTDHLIRAQLWSPMIKEILEDELWAQRYIKWLDGFPDGDVFNIPSIGDAEALNYEENQAVRYTAMDTGNFQFSITDYVTSATYITEKMLQDSYYASQLTSQFVPKQARAIAVRMETDVLSIGQPGKPGGQTSGSLNSINGGDHRFVASGTSGTITPQDFARAKYALQKARVPQQNLVAIVDPSVEFALSTMTNLVNVSNNPRWEGIVRDGMSSGMRFLMNVYGFDVYVSNYLPNGITETINGATVTSNGVANLFFSAAPDVLPFVGALRMPPRVDSEWDKDLRREEYVTATRYGFKLYRPENLVTILSANTLVL